MDFLLAYREPYMHLYLAYARTVAQMAAHPRQEQPVTFVLCPSWEPYMDLLLFNMLKKLRAWHVLTYPEMCQHCLG